MEIACPFFHQPENGINNCWQAEKSEKNRPLNAWKISEEVFKKYCSSEKFIECQRYKYAIST